MGNPEYGRSGFGGVICDPIKEGRNFVLQDVVGQMRQAELVEKVCLPLEAAGFWFLKNVIDGFPGVHGGFPCGELKLIAALFSPLRGSYR